MKLHYNLDFIKTGEKWPNALDKERLENYETAREQFELTTETAIREIVPEGLMRFAKFEDFAHVCKVLAYPRLLTLKTTDMLIGQPPLINAQGASKDELTEKIKDLRAGADLNAVIKMALIDYSRFAVALFRVFKDEKGVPKITAWNPQDWVPVFYSDGTNRIKYNVIGWHEGGNLIVQIHSTIDGSYEQRKYSLDSAGAIYQLISTKTFNKNSGKRLLYAVINTPTTTNPLGTNDYEIINGLLQKAIQRLQAILRVLDEHADPSLTGPYTLLSKDDKGELVFRTNKFYAIGKDEEKPAYLTWEANLNSSFQAFNELCKQIYILSEMGEAFLGSAEGTGNVVSGTAMRFKMISPLEKARRISNEMTEPLKAIISTMLSLQGDKLENKDINIAWRDSLPKDPREVAELARLESGSVAIKPLINAIMDNYDLDLESAQKYVDDILAYQALQQKQDGREHDASGSIDVRKKGSSMNPASSENRGDDQNAKLN